MIPNIPTHKLSPVFKPGPGSKSTFYHKDLTIELTKNPFEMPKDFGFGTYPADHMLEIYWDSAKGWANPKIVPFHYLPIHPFNTTLHYGLEGFEGMKAFRDPKGQVRVFRPEAHTQRFIKTCQSMCFPTFGPAELAKCIDSLMAVDAKWVPEAPATLYLRPSIISMTNDLGAMSPQQALLFVVSSPSNPLFSSECPPLKLLIETRGVRAWPGGTGNVKVGANYAVAAKYDNEAVENGYDEVLWLNGDRLTEASGCNFFLIWQNQAGKIELVTPELDGTILPGITRDTILEIGKLDERLTVIERKVTVEDVAQADKEKRLLEMFVCGTAVTLMPVGSLTYKGTVFEAQKPHGEIAIELRTKLQDIQFGRVEHKFSHVVPIPK